MANNTAMYGFRWVGGTRVEREFFVKDSATMQDDGSNNVDLQVGDPVLFTVDGTVNIALQASLVFGVCTAVNGVYDSNNGTYGPSNRVPNGATGAGVYDRRTRVMVTLAPGAIWEVDVDDAVTATTQDAYTLLSGGNYIVGTTTRAARYGGYAIYPKIDISAPATTHSHAWRMLAVSKSLANKDFSGSNVKILVMANAMSNAGMPATMVLGQTT